MAGDVAWDYNPNFVATSETVFDGLGAPRSAFFGYDNDLLLTCASPTSCSPVSGDALRLTRHAEHGMVTQLLQGTVTENWTYNTFGELASQVVTASGSPLMAFQYHTAAAPRDALGRITEKAETFGGTMKRIGYTYDVMGRLTDVTIDGAIAEHYEYDLNGNRLLGQTPEGSFVGNYDAQDRLLSYGDFEYTYGANGELFTKTNAATNETTAYTYDVFGNLLAVELPDGRLIEYVTDGKHRRVGKMVDGALVKQWLYRDQLNPVAELDGAGNLVSMFVYGSRGHVPDFMVQGGAVYRIVSDQIGSVRLVVNVANASDVLFRAEYTAFGEMTVLDGDVEATTFGFAGGLFEAETGLTRFGARDYDPVVGRWTAKDPVRWRGHQSNLYLYVYGDPVNFTDQTGHGGKPEGLLCTLVCSGAGKFFGVPWPYTPFICYTLCNIGSDDGTKSCPEGTDGAGSLPCTPQPPAPDDDNKGAGGACGG